MGFLKDLLRDTPFVHEVRRPLVVRLPNGAIIANPRTAARVKALNPTFVVVPCRYCQEYVREWRWFWERWI